MTRLWLQARGVFRLIMHCNEIFIETVLLIINMQTFISNQK